MRAMIITALLLVVGHAGANEQVISVQHDSARGVTCWILNNTGISCLPDSSLPQSGPIERETGRASQASSVTEKELSVATPLPQEERFQL